MNLKTQVKAPQSASQLLSPIQDSPMDIAKSLLLSPWGLDEQHLEGAMAEMFSHQVDYADLYFQYSNSESWSLDEGIVKSGSFNISQGVGVRAVVFSIYPMDIEPFYEMIQGQEMDLVFEQPNTQEELENYSYYVASSVGLMLLPILSKTPEKLRDDAIALGVAMQLTNILRDIGEDLDNDRVYLPRSAMQEFGYTKEMLKRREINAAFIALWEDQAKRAEQYYTEALNMLVDVNLAARRPLYLSLVFYREILEEVRANDYQCFNKRAVVSKRRKLALLSQADEKWT